METVNYLIVFCIFFLAAFAAAVFYMNRRYRAAFKEKEEEIRFLRSMMAKIANEVAIFERTRIAENLHDDVGMFIAVVRQNLQKVMRNPADTEQNLVLLKASMAMLSDSCQAIRDSGHDVPQALIRIGYQGGMEELCSQMSLSGERRINIETSSQEHRLPPLSELYLFRISKEVLCNMIKHADPSEIDLYISSSGTGIETKIFHNGKAVTETELKERTGENGNLGLRGIAKKAEDINATIRYEQNGQRSGIIIFAPQYEE